MRLLDTILEILFPSKCVACGKAGADLCFECLRMCPSAERESATWAFPLYDYRSPVIKKALWSLKYKGKRRLAHVFAEAIHGKIMEELGDMEMLQNFKHPVLVPIPLSKRRHRERGFNQAELISQELMQIDGSGRFTLDNSILTKPKDTEHQARIKDRSLRLRNIQGSFSAKNEERIKGENIILIDDVLTTGATLSEARKILKQAGARKVIAFTVAH